MIRVLLVIDEQGGFEITRSAEFLLRGRASGIEVCDCPISAQGWPAVREAQRRICRAGAFQILHAMGGRALAAAVLAGHRHIVYSPAPESSPRAISWLRAAMHHRPFHIVTPSSTLRRQMIGKGIAPEHCHTIRPGVEFARIKPKRDRALRKSLGFSENDCVILAAGESTGGAAHHIAAWATGILHVLDSNHRFLIWGRGAEAAAVRRFAHRATGDGVICIAEERLGRPVEFEDLLGAADMVVACATGPVATLPIAISMAAGLPIVGVVTPEVSELLEDRHTALMIGKAQARPLARRILELREDSTLQWKLADMARTEAFDYFALTRFMEQWRGVYRQMAAGEKVSVVEGPPGAGQRFHGRA